jgi:hypothetical protein
LEHLVLQAVVVRLAFTQMQDRAWCFAAA